jgi:hypothetical protein
MIDISTRRRGRRGLAAPEEGGKAGGPGGAGRTPGEAPEGVDADTWAAAQQACADLAPAPPDGAGPSSAT